MRKVLLLCVSVFCCCLFASAQEGAGEAGAGEGGEGGEGARGARAGADIGLGRGSPLEGLLDTALSREGRGAALPIRVGENGTLYRGAPYSEPLARVNEAGLVEDTKGQTIGQFRDGFLFDTRNRALAEIGLRSDTALREGPSETYASLRLLRTNAHFTILRTSGNFFYVRLDSGVEGWIPAAATQLKAGATVHCAYFDRNIDLPSQDQTSMMFKHEQGFKQEGALVYKESWHLELRRARNWDDWFDTHILLDDNDVFSLEYERYGDTCPWRVWLGNRQHSAKGDYLPIRVWTLFKSDIPANDWTQHTLLIQQTCAEVLHL
ncbi:MAG: hypothetical protein JOZ48_23600, partial [Acidobacteriaceae bacterium]|nr:hypothetical protein [Acidobacteriaceae bacterium]